MSARGTCGEEGGALRVGSRTVRYGFIERGRERDARSRLRVERWDREGDTVALGPVGVGLSRAPSQFSDSRRDAVSSVVNYYIHIYILYLLYYFNVRRVPFTHYSISCEPPGGERFRS